MAQYPTFASKRAKIQAAFGPVSQPGGLGSKPNWQRDPDECAMSMFGFPRFFTMENKVIKALWEICQNPPKEWRKLKQVVVRRDREQKAFNAVRSALLGAIFMAQGANIRAAGNHEIQSAGATLVKKLQRRFWDLQPSGIHPFQLKTMNVHDELLIPCLPSLVDTVDKVQRDFVTEHRSKVPLLGIDWGSHLKSWAEK